jgi:hypothetical protein
MKRIVILLALAATPACSPPVDVAKAVQVNVVTSGWLAAGTVDGKNKIVPAVAVTLKNASSEPLNALQVNVVFRLVSSNDEIASDFRPVAGSGALPPGGSTGHAVPEGAARLHRHRPGRRFTDELTLRRRQGGSLRQGRPGPVDAPWRISDCSRVHRQLTATASRETR